MQDLTLDTNDSNPLKIVHLYVIRLNLIIHKRINTYNCGISIKSTWVQEHDSLQTGRNLYLRLEVNKGLTLWVTYCSLKNKDWSKYSEFLRFNRARW